MIGLDSNVLVRYLTQDDPKQAPLASRLLESLSSDDPGFVSQVALCGTVWVLESCYAADAGRIGEVVEGILRTDAIRVQHAEVAWRALRKFKVGHGDFSDMLVAAIAADAGSRTSFSFDHGAVKHAGMTLLA